MHKRPLADVPIPTQVWHTPGLWPHAPQGTQTCTGPCCSTTIVVLLPELLLLELLWFVEDEELYVEELDEATVFDEDKFEEELILSNA